MPRAASATPGDNVTVPQAWAAGEDNSCPLRSCVLSTHLCIRERAGEGSQAWSVLCIHRRH